MKEAQAYCVKCKQKKWMVDTVHSVLKNGVEAIKGKCPDCHTGMMKILGKKGAEKKTETAPTKASEPAGNGWTLLG